MTAPLFRSWPEAEECFTVAMADGAVLPVYGLRGPAGAPALLFGHANGLCAGSYAPWLALLARRVRVFAFDARGHGGASWPEGPLETVFADDRMAADLLRLTEAVAARSAGAPLAYVGHSLGAEMALRLLVLGGRPAWRALTLFEPPIFPAPAAKAYAGAVAKHAALVAGALRRRADWAGPEAFFERVRGRGMFARFQDAMLRTHCRAALKPQPGGGYRLACPPAVESAIFRLHRAADTWSRLGAVTRPVALIGGDPAAPDNGWISGALPEMAERLSEARLSQVPGTGHMLIFEAPEPCAELVLAGLAGR